MHSAFLGGAVLFSEGFIAWRAGAPLASNPHEAGGPAWLAWAAGWRQGALRDLARNYDFLSRGHGC